MKIKELPFSVIWQLCRYLDVNSQQNWRSLLVHAPGTPYTTLDVSAFARVGLQPNGSPSEAVIQDFIVRGLTVDQLFSILHKMGHVAGMKSLREYVSLHNQQLIDIYENEDNGDHGNPPVVNGSDDGHSFMTVSSYTEDTNRSLDSSSPPAPLIHPEFGPLPPNLPQGARGPHPDRHKQNGTKDDPTLGSKIGEERETSVSEQRRQRGNRAGEGLAEDDGRRGHALRQGRQWMDGEVETDSPRERRKAGDSPDQERQGGKPMALVAPQASTESRPNGEWNGSYPQPVPGAISYERSPHLASGTRPHAPWPRYPPEAVNTPPRHLAPVQTSEPPGPPVGRQWPTQAPPTHSHLPPGVRLPPSALRDPSRASGLSWSTDYATTPPSSLPLSLSSQGSISPSILTFQFSELSEATEDFTKNMVGMGSFGSVFVAKIRGNGPFAIKKLHSQSEMEGGLFYEAFHHETFSQEVLLLTKYNHRNILSLVACSNDGPRPCLVYEYMENGSLADCLLGKRNVQLPWKLRLEIANQIADALHFLHTVNQSKCLVHGDVKSANILLDTHCTPKLSDFGLARECHTRTHQHSTYSTQSSVVMGTVAYMAPEFLRNRKLTRKTDVYSFGVVLLELFTGLAADDPTVEQRTLTERLVHLIEDTYTHQREIATHADPRAVWPQGTGFDLFNIATVCLTPRGKDRPHMDQVRDQLSDMLQEADSARWPYSGVS